MRLATIKHGDGTAAAVVREGRVAVVPVPGGGGAAFRDVGALLRAGEAGLASARRVHDAGDGVVLAPGALRRPVLDPGAVLCVGLNYAKHIREMRRELPEHPTLFSRLPRSLADPDATIALPAASRQADYEGELAVVIGRAGRDVRAADAHALIGGYTIINDVTMRDYQRRSLQWFAGKTFQETAGLGPVVLTPDEVAGPEEFELVVRVNGEERQRARADDLVFGIPELIEDLSRIVRLEPGDVIATGTPGGVGFAMEPPSFLGHGDEVEVEIGPIGILRNRFEVIR